jgi:hypothetical protein
MATLSLLAMQLRWDPGLRGVLVVLVGVAVLMGSVYLVLSTNLGARLGVLVTVAGLSGWMFLMGLVWAVYGIGYKGPAPSWKLEETVVSASSHQLPDAKLEKAHDLSSWQELSDEDPRRGDAAAAATAYLIAPESAVTDLYTSDADFKVVDAFEVGGKKKSFYDNWFPGFSPPHYAIVQVQGIQEVEVPFGETPPPSKADPSKPIVSVVMVRDLGKLRLPSVTLAAAAGIVFAVTCNALHRRDKAIAAARTAAAAAS